MIHWESFMGIYTQYTRVYLPCNAIIYFLTLRWYTIPEITVLYCPQMVTEQPSSSWTIERK